MPSVVTRAVACQQTELETKANKAVAAIRGEVES